MKLLQFLIYLFLCNYAGPIYAQTVDFSASDIEGCGTLDVTFTNESVPSGTTFLWDFGNSQTSTLENPSIIYTSPGIYDVSLTVDGGLTETKVAYITVHSKPVPDFTSGSTLIGCAPFDVSYNGSAGASTIASWYWDFGDGNTSSLQNPVHTYDIQNTLTVSLVVVDNNNCQGAVSKINFVKAYKPAANFSADNRFACEGNLTANFTNSSSVLGAAPTYFWDFGDGNNSTQTNPSHTYVDKGHYGVALTVTDENNCSNTKDVKSYIVLENVKANFTTNADTICPNTSVQFKNLSTNANNYFWDFGDSTVSTAFNPTHIYAETGNYEVKLRVSSSGVCFDTYKRTINVEEVIADFSLSSYFSCELPTTINYINNSVNGATWDWRFGNKTFSNNFEPDIVYNQKGTYVDTLIVTSKHGCTDQFISGSPLEIEIPRAYCTPNTFVRPSESEGCIPLTVNFKDESTYSTSSDYIETRAWSFGDGKTSNEINPTNQYTSINTFTVTFEITTKHGCKSSTNVQIRTGDIQKANFTKNSSDTICASQKVQFTDLSKESQLINGWYWDFGDEKSSTKQNPLHAFTDVGSMDVTLLAFYNGCPSKIVKNDYIYVKGPYAEINYSIDCNSPYNAALSSNILGATGFKWDFGDGSPDNTVDQNPNHTYAYRGNYNVNLHADNTTNNCTYDIEGIVSITDIKANFSTDKNIGCTNMTVNLDAGASTDPTPFIYNSTKRRFLWDFADNSPIVHTNDMAINHNFTARGDFPVKLTVRDIHGCESTMVKNVKTYRPVIQFEASQINGCKPMTVNFSNNTVSDTIITGWEWDFGDGNTSSEITPEHIYQEFGTYDVSLKVTDLIGCESVLEKKNYIEALRPSPDFSSSGQNVCTDTEVSFKALTTDKIVSYLWNFGDGDTSTLANPMHTYTNSGEYDVSLSLIDDVGCDSAATEYSYMSVQSLPIPDFIGDDLFTDCFPLIVNYTDRTVHPNLAEWNWDFGDGSFSEIQNPLHIYNRPGDFDISLTAKTSYGCTGLIQKIDYVHVGGPYAVIVSEDTICKSVETMLIASNPENVHQIKWFFDNGVTVENDTATHTYNKVGMVYPVLLLTVDDAQTCDKYFVDSIYIKELIAGIGTTDNKYTGCIPFDVPFVSNSQGASIWSWEFGEEATAKIEDPYYVYHNSGKFNIRLIVSDELGCLDTASALITAYPLPTVVSNPDTLICLGESVQLEASGGESYNWIPNYFLDNNLISNPLSTPGVTTNYAVWATDSNNCSNLARVTVFVQQEPNVNLSDTSIIIGEIVVLDAYSKDILSYYWSSNYDIECQNCPSIEVKPLTPTSFDLTYTDTSNCFIKNHSVFIDVIKAYTVDLPQAFTPNGDGINDVIFVRGWGVKELIEFKIFNRFGEKVFESNDMKQGWDGRNNGNSQHTETFTYALRVKTYDDKILTKTGTIKLLK